MAYLHAIRDCPDFPAHVNGYLHAIRDYPAFPAGVKKADLAG
jgi:hypothetical protein